ncbi:MAG: hypothetical protein AAFO02_15235 [Bacteroidota bacterium]
MDSSTFKTLIALGGDSTTLSGQNVNHHGWGEAFAGEAHVMTPQVEFKQPWNVTAIDKDYSGISAGVRNYGKPGATAKSFYDDKNWWGKIKNSNPVYAFLMFGQNETSEDDMETNLTAMVKELVSDGIKPVIVSLVPPRIPGGTPAPIGSACYTYAKVASTVATAQNTIFIDAFNHLLDFFTSKGGTWVESNIDAADDSGLVHYSPSGSAIISQQIAGYMANNDDLSALTSYLVDGTTDSFACTENC